MHSHSLVGTVVLLVCLAIVAVQIGTDLCAYTDTVPNLDVPDLASDLDGTTCEQNQRSSSKMMSGVANVAAKVMRSLPATLTRHRDVGTDVVCLDVPMISCPTQRGRGVSPQPPVIAVCVSNRWSRLTAYRTSYSERRSRRHRMHQWRYRHRPLRMSLA